jgi:hypothetical protein
MTTQPRFFATLLLAGLLTLSAIVTAPGQQSTALGDSNEQTLTHRGTRVARVAQANTEPAVGAQPRRGTRAESGAGLVTMAASIDSALRRGTR